MFTSAITSGTVCVTPPIVTGIDDPKGITANVVSAGIIMISGARL